MTEADAVVIGAGPNGLVAANILADAGWSVLVLEAASSPGGAVRTEEVIEPGFHTDLFSAFYPLGAVSPILRGLDLDRYGLRWRHADIAVAHLMPDDHSALLSRDVEETATSVGSFAASDADAWRRMVAEFTRIRDDLIDAVFTPFPPVRAGVRLLRTLGTAEALRFARMTVMPVRAFADERFIGEGAKALLTGNALHTDLGPRAAGSAVFGWLLCMVAQHIGFPVPEGGAGNLSGALVRRLEDRGGRIECARRVTRVLTANGRAIGVQDASGERVRAKRAVLAAVPAPALYLDMLDPADLPGRLLRDLNGFGWDDATIKVDWTLSAPIPWRNPDVSRAGTVHMGADNAGMSDFSADLASGRVPRDPYLIMGQMTTTDPTRSPTGTETAWAYTHVPRGLPWTRDDLRDQAERVERVIERQAPGFTDLIRGRYVQGPADMSSRDLNLVEGAINAGSAAPHQQVFLRPTPGLGRSDTPVDRLYLASASAHPGGAVHGGPGANAARAALTRAGYGGSAYSRLIRTLNGRVYRD